VARRPVPIDLDELEKLAAMHCTHEEAAAFFSRPAEGLTLSRQAFEKKLSREPFKSVWERGWAAGSMSLRRWQMNLARDGNATMQIWLGKQWLGQRDVARVEHSGGIEVSGALQRLEDEIAGVIAEAERAIQQG